MGFGSFDDMSPLHPKLLALSDGAHRLWFNLVIYSNRSRSKGVIPKSLVPSCDHRRGWTDRQIAGFLKELTSIAPGQAEPLLHDEGDHYLVHDYDVHQRYSMKQAEEQEAERVRKADYRARKKRGVSPGLSQGQLPGLSAGHETDTTQDNPEDKPGTVPSMSLARDTRDPSPDPDPSPTPQSASRSLSSARDDGPSLATPKHIAKFEASLRPPASSSADFLSIEDVESAFSELRRAAGGGPYRNANHRDDAHLEAIAKAANGEGETRVARELVLRAMVTNFLDERARAAGFPLGWLASDPGRYLAKTARRASEPTTNDEFRARVEAQAGKGATCAVRDV